MPANIKKALYLQFARTTKALSSPVRLQIIDLLSQGPKSVEAIAQQLNLGVKNASAQLKELKSAELVGSRKEGKFVFYFIRDTEVINLWRSIRSFGVKRFSEVQKITEYVFKSPHELKGVNRKDLLARAKAGKIIILDVRPEDEYQTAHIPYAISIPSSEISKRINELPKDKDIVAYCRGPYCYFSKSAVETLRKKGFKAFQLNDSVHDWQDIK